MQRMHVGFFDAHPVGRLVTRLTSDVDAINDMFTDGVLAIVNDAFMLTIMAIVMLAINWWLALLAFSVLPLIWIVTRIFRDSVRESYRRVRAAIARINSFIQEHITGMTVVQLFNREARAYTDFEAVDELHMIAFKDTIFAYALYYPTVELLSSVAIALVVWLGGSSVMARGAVTVGMLAMFIQYAQRFWRPIQDLSDKYNILQAAMAACERIFKLLDTPPEILNPAEPQEGDGSNRIEFDHVWFTYQKLTDVQKAAVAAASGRATGSTSPDGHGSYQGTTSVVSQAAQKEVGALAPLPDAAALAAIGHGMDSEGRLIHHRAGAVGGHRGAYGSRQDDADQPADALLRRHGREHSCGRPRPAAARSDALRRHFAVVLQDPFLFTGTIGDNIRFGSEEISDERMRQAAVEVNVLDFVESLPGRFDEPVRERGSSLSTGQKQLVNFARALAFNPRILILDKATSSVDTDTELRIRSALDRMVEGRTSLLIAHRLSTIQRADTILVMHKGQLRERGSHQELLAQRGLYWKLYQLQYKDQEVGAASVGTQAAATAD